MALPVIVPMWRSGYAMAAMKVRQWQVLEANRSRNDNPKTRKGT